MNVGEGEEVVPEMAALFFQIGERGMEQVLQLPAHIEIDGGVDMFLQLGLRDAGSCEDIALIIVRQPVILIVLVVAIAEWADEAEVKMRLFGDITDDAGDLTGSVVFEIEAFAYDVGGIEVFSCGSFVDDDGVGFIECGSWIAGYHGECEDLEDGGVGIAGMVVLYPGVAFFDHDVALVVDADHLFEFRIVVDEGSGEGSR